MASGLGSSLPQAQQDSFFTWFFLRPVERSAAVSPAAGVPAVQSWTQFRPSGESFHDLVVLELGVDAAERIRSACLGIDRRFIKNVRVRPFARDIAASFLRWSLPAEGFHLLSADIARIAQFCDGESPLIVHRDTAVQYWLRWWRGRGEEPAAAAVFMGRRWRMRQRLGNAQLLVENLIGALPPDVARVSADAPRGLAAAHTPAWVRLAVTDNAARG